MPHRNVFLSSPTGYLAEYRKAAYAAIEGLREYHCVRMEDFGALDWQADEFCRARIGECDLFVGILGPFYGSAPLGHGISYSEREYEAAVTAGIPRLIFLSLENLPVPANCIEDDSLREKQRAFRERVRKERICNTFFSPADLSSKVRQAIHNWEPRPGGPGLVDLASQFRLYFTRLDKLFEEFELGRLYVSLDCTSDEQTVDSLDRYTEQWLEDKTRKHLAILGDYGTGKTWFCTRLAKQLADRFRAAPEQSPFPLLISFRRYQPHIDLFSLIKCELLESYGVDISNTAVLGRLLNAENTILILDGLDEMSKQQKGRSALMAYHNLGLPANGPKVIVTCRTHYFHSGSEQREVINIDHEQLSIDKLPAFEVVHVKMLDKPKLVRCIEGRFDPQDRAEVLHFINSTYNLSELCLRPVLLTLVCDSYDLLSDIGQPFSSAALYEKYVDAWLRRELMTGRLHLDPSSVTAIVEDLAHHMVSNDTLILIGQKLEDILTTIFKKHGVSLAEWRDLHRQMITSTFIRRSDLDTWEFAHRSFQEFFYARKFFRWEEAGAKGEFPVTHVPVWQFVSQLVLLRWDEQKAMLWIPQRIDRHEEPTLTLTTLRAAAAYWLLKRGPRPARDYTLAGIMLDSVDLQGTDFYQCDLLDANFFSSDLEGANFSKTKLKGSTFQLSNLDKSTFANAQAPGVDFRWASFLNADLSNADLQNALLDSASFAGAKLLGAQLKGATIFGADFRDAYFGETHSDLWRQSMAQLKGCIGIKTARFDKNVAASLSEKRS